MPNNSSVGSVFLLCLCLRFLYYFILFAREKHMLEMIMTEPATLRAGLVSCINHAEQPLLDFMIQLMPG